MLVACLLLILIFGLGDVLSNQRPRKYSQVSKQYLAFASEHKSGLSCIATQGEFVRNNYSRVAGEDCRAIFNRDWGASLY
jgi:hypothetical protein